MDLLVAQGKVIYVGSSNFAAWNIDRPGSGVIPSRDKWVRMDLGPHLGWVRRISTIRASTTGDI